MNDKSERTASLLKLKRSEAAQNAIAKLVKKATTQNERVREPEGFRHVAPGVDHATDAGASADRRSHDRWVVNKIRALGGYYTKGVENGAELRAGLNTTSAVGPLRDLIARFFQLEGAGEA